MKIHNIRLGFATNSSSSHSIIYNPSVKLTDDYGEDFGWDFFTLSSKEAKDKYMASMLVENLIRKDAFSQDLIKVILKGLNLIAADNFYEDDDYSWKTLIDHQSVYHLPRDYGTKAISLEFFNDFRNYLLRDGVHILGGNDNTEDRHPICEDTNSVALNFNGYLPEEGSWICRKDNEWWILFDENSGNRIILSFEDNPKPFKPVTPMLIDFKISDYCPIGCNYCYQGSTVKGNHINRDDVLRILYDIKEAQVFEVALGGGEPTMCPEFLRIIEGLNCREVKVNFTTKSMEWLENPVMVHRIMPLIGSFAYSVSNQYDIDRIVTILKYHNIGLNKFTVQLIPGACSNFAMESILKKCHEYGIRVTLLGFKETGRGMDYKTKYSKSFDESSWVDVIKKLNAEYKCPLIAIDTTLASRYEKELKESGIPEWLYHIQEGRYSAYIDGVQMKFGPSSYHLDKLIPYESRVRNVDPILSMFSKIEEV